MLRGIYGVKSKRWIAELRIKGFARIIEKQKKKERKKNCSNREKFPRFRKFEDNKIAVIKFYGIFDET